jgi:hypothetical protein
VSAAKKANSNRSKESELRHALASFE